MADTATSPDRPFTSDELAEIRAELPAARANVYLNAGFMGPMPVRTRVVLAQALEKDADRRTRSTWPEELTEAHRAATDAVGSLTGVAPAQVALTHGTHVGINLALWGLDLAPGDNLVTCDEEHPSLLSALRIVRDRLGVEIRTVEFGDGGAGTAERLAGACDRNTQAVVVSHVSWLSGGILDPVALAESVPAHVRTILDGAQSVGIVPVDIAAWGVDACTVSGQKWPMGPGGSGALVLLDPEAWRPTFGAYTTTRDPVDPLSAGYAAGALRFEFAQDSFERNAALAASIGFLHEVAGVHRASAHARRLNAYARRLLANAGDEGAAIAGSARGDAHLLALTLPRGIDCARLVRAMEAEEGVLVRELPVHQVIRVSIGAWNTPADIDTFVDALATHLGWG